MLVMDVSKFFPPQEKVAYFDSAASSLTALPVLKKMDEYYLQYRSNVHRGAHRFTRKSSEEYEGVYKKLAKFFHAKESEFISVRNCTEGINGVALGREWKEGDEVIVTDMEHHSNLLPWLQLKKKGVKVRVLEAEMDGSVDAEKLRVLLSKKTKLFAFSACSNVLGAKVPVEKLAKIAKEEGALILLDAAQYVGHHPLDLGRMPVDFMAFSAHKCFGPTGVGALFHREGAQLEPWFVGGGTVRNVSTEEFSLLENRERFEAGTPAIAEWIGLGAAIELISQIGYGNMEAHEKKLVGKMLSVFLDAENVKLYGPKSAEEKGCALFSFNVKSLAHHEVAVMLDNLGFALRSGHHCAIPLAKKLGVEGTVRASLHVYNTQEQIQGFEEALGKVAKLA